MYSSIQKKLFSQSSSSSYLIPILLLVCSFVIYSFNLEGQPWYMDETVYLPWGGNYFDLIKEGDLTNPCLKTMKDCELIYSEKRGHEINYTPIRNFFVGFGQYLTTGENKGDFYLWSSLEWYEWNYENIPTTEEFASGRFFSPIFGSLAVVLAFFIGKILFNRTTGLFFSLILLFYGAWIMYSRMIMTEAYLHFFIFLSIFLLLKSFNKESKHRIAYFISGAISFGFALNTKLVAIELAVPILVMILFYNSFNEKLNFRFFKNKKNLLKVTSLVLVFFVISSVSFVATFPKYYDNTLNQIQKTRSELEGAGWISSFPYMHKNYLFRGITTLQVTLLPYLIDDTDTQFRETPFGFSLFTDIFPDQSTKFFKGSPANFSTIPLTLFFFVGLIYMINSIKTGNLKFSEFALLVWFASMFIFIVLTLDWFHVERYYFPVMFPIMLIASYGLWRFVKQIQNQKEKILFSAFFIITHSLYLIPSLNKIYFSPWSFMESPLPVYSQFSLNDPLVYFSSILFMMIFVLIYLRIKTTIPAETNQVSSSQQN